MSPQKITRRDLLKVGLAAPAAELWRASAKARAMSGKVSDIRIEHVSISYQDYIYRIGYKFGGRVVDRVTLLNVVCHVLTVDGCVGKGFGSMPMGNVWTFPSAVMSYETTLGAMKALAEQIPKLCTLGTASPFDAAIHDAFGKVHGLNCYHTYGSDFMANDLARYVKPEFNGEFARQYILENPTPRTAIYHSIGACDPLVDSDLIRRLNDGLPETLPEWINYDHLTHFKIKLNVNDLNCDLERDVRIDRIVNTTMLERNTRDWTHSLDFNEKCPNVEYVLEFCRKLKEQTPTDFDRIQYLEHPTARDVASHCKNTMREAAKLRPVVIDESLTGLDTLLLAREMGYAGVALNACKGESETVLMAAAAQMYGMFLCVQDLTCRVRHSFNQRVLPHTFRTSALWRRMPASMFLQRTSRGKANSVGYFKSKTGPSRLAC